MDEKIHHLIHKLPTDTVRLRLAIENLESDLDELLLLLCKMSGHDTQEVTKEEA